MLMLALLPLFLLIALGYGLRRASFPSATFWPAAERITYYLLFPALLVARLSQADLHGQPLGRMTLALLLLLGLMSAASLAAGALMRGDGPGLTSVYQGAIRFNTYLGIAVADAWFGATVTALAGVVVTVLIPLVNVLCVLVLSRWGSGPSASGVALLQSLAGNPLILACLAGGTLNLLDIGLPMPLLRLLELLGGAALPLGLLAVGAGLHLRLAWQRPAPIALSSVLRLCLSPALALLLCNALALPPALTQTMVLFAALPTASSAFILARQLGGDAALMAAIITAQTAACLDRKSVV